MMKNTLEGLKLKYISKMNIGMGDIEDKVLTSIFWKIDVKKI